MRKLDKTDGRTRRSHRGPKRAAFWAMLCGLLTSGMLAGCGTAPSQNQAVNRTSGQPAHANQVAKTSPSATRSKTTWPTFQVDHVANLPHPAIGNALTPHAGQVISVGGYTGSYSLVGVYRWPGSAKTTSPATASLIGELPARTHDAAVGFIGPDLYVFGGGQSASYNTVVRVQGGTAKVAAHLSSRLSDAVCVPFTWHGQSGLVLLGGYDGQVMNRTVRFASVESGKLSLQSMFTMPQGLRYTAAAAIGQTLLFAGGETSTGGVSNAVYAWSQAGGPRVIAHLPVAIDKAAAFVVGQDLVVAGGKLANGQPVQSVYAIDVKTGKVHENGKLPTPLADMGYTQVGQTGYLAGGQTAVADVGTTRVYAIHFNP